jgi:hypothetical protein
MGRKKKVNIDYWLMIDFQCQTLNDKVMLLHTDQQINNQPKTPDNSENYYKFKYNNFFFTNQCYDDSYFLLITTMSYIYFICVLLHHEICRMAGNFSVNFAGWPSILA